MRLFQPVATAPPSKKIKVNNAGEIQSVYYCHLCGSEYIIKFNLQKHLEKAHTETERNVRIKQMLVKHRLTHTRYRLKKIWLAFHLREK